MVYFLFGEDRRLVLKGLRAKAREISVSENFRGWAWNSPPIEPPYDVRLPLYEVAANYCETGRDIYLRHVERVKPRLSREMISGLLYHETVSRIFLEAKRFLYRYGSRSGWEVASFLREIMGKCVGKVVKENDGAIGQAMMSEGEIRKAVIGMKRLWSYETGQIAASIDRILAMQPYIGIDALVHSAVPFVTECRLDGRHIGLSGSLRADAFALQSIILDLKTGKPRDFHRLTTTGYALVYESVNEYPIDIGCVTYVSFREDLPVPGIRRMFHLIGDEDRQNFLETRDGKMRIVYEEMDPGKSRTCYEKCPYKGHCG